MSRRWGVFIALVFAAILILPTVAQSNKVDDLETDVVEANKDQREAEEERDALAGTVTALQEQVEAMGGTPVVTPDEVETPEPIIIRGRDGKDGANGTPGQDGTPGEDGEPGEDGTDGSDGSDALPPTPEELQGAAAVALLEYCAQETQPCKGERGEDGTDGADGAPGTFPATFTLIINERDFDCTTADGGQTIDCQPKPLIPPN